MLCHGEINKLIALYVSIICCRKPSILYVFLDDIPACPDVDHTFGAVIWWLCFVPWWQSCGWRAIYIAPDLSSQISFEPLFDTMTHNCGQKQPKLSGSLVCQNKSTILIELWRWCCFYTKEAWENRKACSPVSINWFLNDSLTKLWSGPIIQTSHCCH